MQATTPIHSDSAADRRMLTNGLTLIALGLSILFLNSWDSLFVRASVGLFWGTFFLILNGPDAVRVLQRVRQKNDRQRRSDYGSST
jgi:tetrahydromethanopterin S-methyltransferase subunit E